MLPQQKAFFLPTCPWLARGKISAQSYRLYVLRKVRKGSGNSIHGDST